MAYKPNKLSTEYRRGIALVRRAKNAPQVQIQFEDEENAYVLNIKNCPSVVLSGRFNCTLNGDKTKLLAIYPPDGMFKVRVDGFAHKDGEPPAPKTFVGAQWSYQYFTALLEIAEGGETGMIIPAVFRYHFGEDNGVVAYSHAKSKYTAMLDDFCSIAGAWERGEMKYQDNILPMLEKRILRENRTFNILMKDGYLNTIFADTRVIEEDDVELDLTEEVLEEEFKED